MYQWSDSQLEEAGIKESHFETFFELANNRTSTISKVQLKKLVRESIFNFARKPIGDKNNLYDWIAGAYDDYQIGRDHFLAAYARDVRNDSHGKRDERKFQLSIEKIAKREGLAEGWTSGSMYYPENKSFLVRIFARADFRNVEQLHQSMVKKGEMYEQAVLKQLISLGASGSLTSRGADFGGDIIFTISGSSFVGQCKAWTKAVGLGAIQEVVAAIPLYEASAGVVFSESGFTEGALRLAEANKVAVVTGLDVISFKRQIAVFEDRPDVIS